MKDLLEQIPFKTDWALMTINDPSRLLILPPNQEQDLTKIMSSRVDTYRNKFQEKLPQLPDNEIEYILDVLFGPFNLDKIRFPKQESGDNTVTNEEKTHSAKVQHMMTNMVLFGGGTNASDEIRNKVIRQLNQYETISTSEFGKKIELGIFLGGVRNEIGIIKALLAGGFKITLPNYEPNLNEKNFMDSQVYKWDVKQGVDLVATKGSDIFLIDAKGTRYFENSITKKPLIGVDGKELIRDKVDIIEKQHYDWNIAQLMQTDGLDTIFAQHPRGKVHKLTIMIPTAHKYLSRVLAPSQSSQSTLRGYSRLNNDLATAIIMGLDNSCMSSLGKAVSNEGGYEYKVA